MNMTNSFYEDLILLGGELSVRRAGIVRPGLWHCCADDGPIVGTPLRDCGMAVLY